MTIPGVRRLLALGAAIAALSVTAAAQDMSQDDLTRLEQAVDEIHAELVTLRQRDRDAARALQNELIQIEEEVTYLKVKLRRERVVPRAEYIEVRDRLEDLRARVSGATGTPPSRTREQTQARGSGSSSARNVVPGGTELDVRLDQRLSSDTARVEDRFEATTVVDLRQDGRVIIPAGSLVRGVVTDVKNAGRLERKGELQLSFDQITVNDRAYPMRGTVVQALEAGGYREDAGKIGTGAAVGAILGGILGGVRGALAGILIGGGGVVAATEGEDVELPVGTVLRVRLDQPLELN